MPRKGGLVVALIVALLSLASTPEAGSEPRGERPGSHVSLANPGFEAWSDRSITYPEYGPSCNGWGAYTGPMPDNWESLAISSSLCLFEPEGLQPIAAAHSGASALRLGGTGYGVPGFQTGFTVAQEFAACPEDTHALGGWVRGENAAGALTAYLTAEYLDRNRVFLQYGVVLSVPEGNAYQLFNGTTSPAPAGTAFVRITLRKSSWGYADFDDVSAAHLAVGRCPVAPPRITDVSVAGARVRVEWSPSPSENVTGYEVFAGPSQVSLDLATVVASTPPTQRWWEEDNPATESYYVVRAVRNVSGYPIERSLTSNTGGYVRLSLSPGWNTASLPLRPFAPLTARSWTADPAVAEVRWQTAGTWNTTATDDEPLRLGSGYAVLVTSPTEIDVGGEPAAMILHAEGFGFDAATRASVRARLDGADVHLEWTPAADASVASYRVFRSAARDGFHGGTVFEIGAPGPLPERTDPGAAATAGELYYLVVPYDANGSAGASAYSVGVVTAGISGPTFFGLPLKPWAPVTADAWLDSVPTSLGLLHLVPPAWTWVPHFREMPGGVFDTPLGFARGYEAATRLPQLVRFVGW
jgi:hypothetical protein